MSPLTTIQEVDFSKSEQYTLSIRISTDGFSFSIYNPLSENPYTIFDLAIDPKVSLIANLKDLITNHPFLSQLYKKVNIVMAGTKIVVQPQHLFSEELAQELFFYGQKLLSTNIKVCYNELERNNLVVLFGLNKNLHHFITEHFRTPQIYAQNSPLIAYFSKRSFEGNSNKMFVHIEANSMSIYCFKKGRLLLTNAFNATEISNQVYYILYIWKHLNFSQKGDELIFYGSMHNKEELLDIVKRYIISVSSLISSEYIDLKSIKLCE